MTSDNNDVMKKELERLRAENETLKQTKYENISFKVGQKGGMSIVWAWPFSRHPV
jgi:hypothetical protein